ncbi:MAG TPA: BTAD domain-containing putative transcriptional regulator [Micromonosporaceae bacterium]
MSQPDSTAEVRVQLCGRFAFVVAGSDVHAALPGRRARLLLAYLVAHRDQATSRGSLLAALWPDGGSDSSAASLTVVLSKVRALIVPAEIAGRGTLQLRLPPGAIVDVERAVEAVHQAESAAAQQQWHRAWGPAVAAQLIAARGFLPEYDESWIEPWRAQVELIYQRALICYAQACLGIGGPELPGAERSARRLIERAPFSETGYRLLMQALAQRSDTTAALAVYDQLRRALRDELGVDPGPEARRLHRELLEATRDSG